MSISIFHDKTLWMEGNHGMSWGTAPSTKIPPASSKIF